MSAYVSLSNVVILEYSTRLADCKIGGGLPYLCIERVLQLKVTMAPHASNTEGKASKPKHLTTKARCMRLSLPNGSGDALTTATPPQISVNKSRVSKHDEERGGDRVELPFLCVNIAEFVLE